METDGASTPCYEVAEDARSPTHPHPQMAGSGGRNKKKKSNISGRMNSLCAFVGKLERKKGQEEEEEEQKIQQVRQSDIY